MLHLSYISKEDVLRLVAENNVLHQITIYRYFRIPKRIYYGQAMKKL